MSEIFIHNFAVKIHWDRQGEDCAYILRGLASAEQFVDLDNYENDPAFSSFFVARYKGENLKRNSKRQRKGIGLF